MCEIEVRRAARALALSARDVAAWKVLLASGRRLGVVPQRLRGAPVRRGAAGVRAWTSHRACLRWVLWSCDYHVAGEVVALASAALWSLRRRPQAQHFRNELMTLAAGGYLRCDGLSKGKDGSPRVARDWMVREVELRREGAELLRLELDPRGDEPPGRCAGRALGSPWSEDDAARFASLRGAAAEVMAAA